MKRIFISAIIIVLIGSASLIFAEEKTKAEVAAPGSGGGTGKTPSSCGNPSAEDRHRRHGVDADFCGVGVADDSRAGPFLRRDGPDERTSWVRSCTASSSLPSSPCNGYCSGTAWHSARMWGSDRSDLSWVGLKGVGLDPYPDYGGDRSPSGFHDLPGDVRDHHPGPDHGGDRRTHEVQDLRCVSPSSGPPWSTTRSPTGFGESGGWIRNLGALDFAGGTVVHISSGISALAAAVLVGKRKGYRTESMAPHNLPMTITGAAILWFGWFGFNAGSAIASGKLSTSAFVVTHIATAGAALSWAFLEWIYKGKPTTLGAASGAVAGLVAITPGSGFVGPMSALLIGLGAGIFCYVGVLSKNRFRYDDSLDVVGVHGVGGTWGALATGLFASKAINDAGADGFFFGNPGLFGIQALTVVVTWVYAFVVTFILLKILDWTMGLRVSEEEEENGLDLSQHSETGYNF